MTVILGIDPGTNITGYGIIKLEESKPTYLHHELLKTGLKNMYTLAFIFKKKHIRIR